MMTRPLMVVRPLTGPWTVSMCWTTRPPRVLCTITLPGISGISTVQARPSCLLRARPIASAAGPDESCVDSSTLAVVMLLRT
ncbi:hypothetical protein CK485_14185 [Streptomyces sp. ICBB 8177]|nr:hypothetical protein CK485_14185 [Streptomyces sp. ICBB 8177]